MNLRKCKICKLEQSVELFPTAGVIDGKQYYRHKCNECYQGIKRKRRHKLRLWLNNYKKGLSCKNCGIADYRVLDFHHPNDDKEYNVSEMVVGFSVENMLVEIKKCDVLCANCHRILHFIRD